MDKLTILNDLSWIMESLACDFTGEAKDGISDLLRKLEGSDIQYDNLIEQLHVATQLINDFNKERAARILTPIIRELWREVED